MFYFRFFSTRFATDRSFASMYTVNDPRYTVADQLGAGMEVRRGTADDVVEES